VLGRRFADAVAPALAAAEWFRPREIRQAQFTTAGQDPRRTRLYTINALGLGPAAVAGLPAELFVEYIDRIRDGSPFKTTLLLGFNGSGRLGYIGTPPAYEEGGYETGKGPALSPAEEQRLIDAKEPDADVGRARLDTGDEIARQALDVLARLAS
jgi:hypothetical protein